MCSSLPGFRRVPFQIAHDGAEFPTTREGPAMFVLGTARIGTAKQTAEKHQRDILQGLPPKIGGRKNRESPLVKRALRRGPSKLRVN
jgi:hypothetical protein